MSQDQEYLNIERTYQNDSSVLHVSVPNRHRLPGNRHTSNDVESLVRKLGKWRKISITVTIITISAIIFGIVIFLTTCNKQELQKLKERTCPKYEMPCRYCAQNWIYFSGNCYLFSMGSATWQASRDTCVRLQSELAVIKSREEETFFEETAHRPSWIGLSKANGGSWNWEDGSTLVSNGFWKTGDRKNSGDLKTCVTVYPSVYANLSGWNSEKCYADRRYVCKQPAFTLSIA